MANTKKTTSKPATKSKVISGGVKSLSFKKKLLGSLLIVLVVGLVGFLGVNAYKAQSLKAQAAGMRVLGENGGVKVQACRIYTVYGHFVKVLYSRQWATSSPTYAVGSDLESKRGNSWWGWPSTGQVAALQIYVGDANTSKITAVTHDYFNYSISTYNLPSC